MLLVVGLIAAAATPAVLPDVLIGVRGRLPWFPARLTCTPIVVEVIAAPLARPAVDTVVAPLQDTVLPDGHCLRLNVREQDPVETVGSSGVLPAARSPQIWVSDSSLWTTQMQNWKLQQVGSLGRSPIVLISSAAAVERSGWKDKPPTWAQAMDGSHPLVNPDPNTSAEGTLGMLALWQATGKGKDADKAIAAALLACARTRMPGGQSATQVALSNSPDAPLIIGSEIGLIRQNQDSANPNLAAVYPADGSPTLDFPVLRVNPDQRDAEHTAATTAVLAALIGDPGISAAHAIGIRNAAGKGGMSSVPGVSAVPVKELPGASVPELAGFRSRLILLSAPSRVLTVVDVSGSMRTTVAGSGLNRVELASKAVLAGGDLLGDTSSAGMWIFATGLDGTHPYTEITPVAPLGSLDGSTTHRAVLVEELGKLDGYLQRDGGTGLYETALAAVRSMRASYDPRAVNTVVLYTDGANDAPGMTLSQLVQALTLDAAAGADRPVRLIAVGMGPTADLAALQAMVAPTKGAAYRADTPADIQKVLYDAMSQRK